MKKTWQREICKDLGSPVATAAIRAVVVVPILAPTVIQYILSNVTRSNPTKGVIVEVTTELLWITIVIPMPRISATYSEDKYISNID